MGLSNTNCERVMQSFNDIKKINIRNIVAFIFALRAITYIWLAFASSIYMPQYAALVNIIRIISVIIGPLYLLSNRYTDREYLAYLLPVFFYWIMLVFNTYGGYEGSYLHELVSISCFLLMDKEEKIKVFKYFYVIIQICNLVSVILYACYIINLPIFNVVPFYNDGTQTSYYHQFGIFAVMGDRLYTLPRLCSIFNEPGALGTVCGLLFAATYSHSSIKEKALLIVTTICTLSMAGYILIMLSFAIHLWKKSWKYSIVILGIIIFFLMIPQIDWGNDMINAFAQRFEVTSSGLAGNDRTNSAFDIMYTQFLKSDNVLFGMGANYTEGTGTATIKLYFIQFGLLGFGLFFFMWIISAVKAAKRNKDCIVLIVVFVISLLQRPVTITNSYGYMLLFGAFSWLLSFDNTVDAINTNYGD